MSKQRDNPSPKPTSGSNNTPSETDQGGRKLRPKTPGFEIQREWDTIDDQDNELDIEEAPKSKLHEKSLKNEKEYQDARKAESGQMAGEGNPDLLHKKRSNDNGEDETETLDEEVKEVRKELNRELYDGDDGGAKEGE